MHEEGLTRFATTQYVTPEENQDVNGRKGKYAHLTNYSINKKNSAFVQNSDASHDIQGSKWSLRGFRKVLQANNIDDRAIFKKIQDVIIKSFVSVESLMVSAF